MNLSNRLIIVIGLGYVGLPLAVEFGKKRNVVGFDIKKKRILELQDGHDQTLEISSDELIAAKYLKFTSDIVSYCSSRPIGEAVFIITVPTPVDKANRPDLTPLIKASETVGSILKAGDVVIYESTVYPGATEEICVPILQNFSRLKCLFEDSGNNESARATDQLNGFYVGYSPERINPGDKSHRLTNIKKITSGSTALAAYAINKLYEEIISAGTHMVSSIKVAEAAKIIENAQRDLNIAFVNELSMIFARVGIDTSEVLTAAATKWNFLHFKPGLVGGHCIGVDPYYLTHKAQELGYRPQVILAGRAINDNMGRYAARNVIRLMLKNGTNVPKCTVGILGITFKENCPDLRNSKVMDIIHELANWGVKVKVMDPWANPNDLFNEYEVTLTKITPQAPVDALIIAVAHQEFANMSPLELKNLCTDSSKPVIADLKALYELNELRAQGFEVFRF